MNSELEYLLNVTWRPKNRLKLPENNLAIAKFYNNRLFPFKLSDDLIEMIHCEIISKNLKSEAITNKDYFDKLISELK